MPGESIATPSLDTARLRLRPFTTADEDALFALHSNARVLRYWDSPPWTDRDRAGRFVGTSRRMAEEGTGARLAIEGVSDGTFIGWCALSRYNADYRSAALGYVLGEHAWGHGYATEAARAVLRWAFDTLDLNRVQSETDTRNAASARVLEKLGFQREGTLREDCVVDGDVSDSWVYGLLRREWQVTSTGLVYVEVRDERSLADWRAIHNAIIPTDPLSLDEVRERSGRNHLEVAYLDGEAIGNSTVRRPNDEAGAVVIARVLPTHRRRGIGTELHRRGLAVAGSWRDERPLESVVLASNEDGLAFALANGWVEVERHTLPGARIPYVSLVLPD